MEIMQEHCVRNNIQYNFKASVGWLLNYLRRITTTGRDLPENSIVTILNFLAEMRKVFIDPGSFYKDHFRTHKYIRTQIILFIIDTKVY